MSGEESGADCFSTLSCGEEKYHACKRKNQCLEAAENLESMTETTGKARASVILYTAWIMERWGLSSPALRKMGAAHA